MQQNPTTGRYSIMDYTVPEGGLPLEIREGIVMLAKQYAPSRLAASAVILEGTRRLEANTFSANALKGFNQGEVINFETNEPEKIEAMRKDLEELLS